MAKYEVVVGISETGTDEFLEEATVLETDDLEEAKEEFEALTTIDEDDVGDDEIPE